MPWQTLCASMVIWLERSRLEAMRRARFWTMSPSKSNLGNFRPWARSVACAAGMMLTMAVRFMFPTLSGSISAKVCFWTPGAANSRKRSWLSPPDDPRDHASENGDLALLRVLQTHVEDRAVMEMPASAPSWALYAGMTRTSGPWARMLEHMQGTSGAARFHEALVLLEAAGAASPDAPGTSLIGRHSAAVAVAVAPPSEEAVK